MPDIIFPSEVLDISDGERLDGICSVDFMHLWGIMCHPRDTAAQDRLQQAISAFNVRGLIQDVREIYGETHEIFVDVDLTLRLLGAPDARAEIEAAGSAIFGGTLAGIVLGYAIFGNVSRGDAFRMIEEATDRRKTGWRGNAGSAETVKKSIWPTFAPVAHLWASLHVFRDRHGDSASRCALITPGGLYEFLLMAEWFRHKGESTTPRRARDPLLSTNETWKIRPDVASSWPSVDLKSSLESWDLRRRIREH